jgi:hypothetical protein
MILRVQMVSGSVTKAYNFYLPVKGWAITQAVSRRLPMTAAWVRTCGICGRLSGTEAGFLKVIQISLPNIPPSTVTDLLRDV